MRENMNIRCHLFAKTQYTKGFTLIELLVVISILGFVAAAVLPLSSRIQDNTKKQKTEQLLDSIRIALIGPNNVYDKEGKRVIGGFVGDFEELPDLVAHTWDESKKVWVIGGTSSTADKYNQNAMPLALWTNYVPMGTGYQALEDVDAWQGPYITPPRDDYPDDDDLFTYTAPNAGTFSGGITPEQLADNREFWLRQGKGRLTDAWGSALLFYMENENLYVVSAGSDRRINYGDSETVKNDGPVDVRLAGNEDNLVMILTKNEYYSDTGKAALALAMLEDFKKGIIGDSGRVTDGVEQPNGFVADIGSLEPLVGTYIYLDDSPEGFTENEPVYKVIRNFIGSYVSGISFSETLTIGGIETLKSDYPFVRNSPDLAASTPHHYASCPELLFTNASYIKYKTVSETEYTYYRAINDEWKFSSTSPHNNSDWVIDNTFAGEDWVPTWNSSAAYSGQILPRWKYYEEVGFGAGWRGPYTSYGSASLHDPWGRRFIFEMEKDEVVLRSCGPIEFESDGKTFYKDDDIVVRILKNEYSATATVSVNPEKNSDNKYLVQMNRRDYVTIFTPYLGRIGCISANINGECYDENGNGGDNVGTFSFTRDYDAKYQDAVKITKNIESGEMTRTSGCSEHSIMDRGCHTASTWIPMGKVLVIYRSSSYLTNSVAADATNTAIRMLASPHPNENLVGHHNQNIVGYVNGKEDWDFAKITDNEIQKNTTKYTYQKNVIIQPGVNHEITLGD